MEAKTKASSIKPLHYTTVPLEIILTRPKHSTSSITSHRSALLAEMQLLQRGYDCSHSQPKRILRTGCNYSKLRAEVHYCEVVHSHLSVEVTAFLEGRLYYRNSDQKVFIVKSADADPLNLIDPLSLKDAGSAPADSLTQIGTNNGLRSVLRTTVARFALSSPEAAVRLDAVREMSQSLDDSTVALLRQRLAVERNSGVKKEIATNLALAALDGSDTSARLEAIATLSQSVSQDVRNRLALLLNKSPDGSFVEGDEKVRQAAAAAVAAIDRWRTFYSGVETLFFGLSLGSVLVLIAIGLAITFGVMGVINMAHGELMMLGAYTTYVVQTVMPGQIGISVLVAIPAAFIVAGLTGVVIERTIIRFLYGRPLETLLATFGVSLILQQTVRSIFSAQQPIGRDTRLDERFAAAERRALDHLQPALHRDLHGDCFLPDPGGVEAYPNRSRHPGRFAESGHGQGDGHPHRVGRCDDVRARIGHRRCGGRRSEPVDQRGSESGAILHHRFVPGGRFWRRRKSLGLTHRRHVHGDRQRSARALRRGRAGKDFRSGRTDSLHSGPAARAVPANRPRGGG